MSYVLVMKTWTKPEPNLNCIVRYTEHCNLTHKGIWFGFALLFLCVRFVRSLWRNVTFKQHYYLSKAGTFRSVWKLIALDSEGFHKIFFLSESCYLGLQHKKWINRWNKHTVFCALGFQKMLFCYTCWSNTARSTRIWHSFYHFASIHHHNGHEIKQSRWSKWQLSIVI